MHCSDYAAGRCRSCTLIELPYAQQLIDKQKDCRSALASYESIEWLPPSESAEAGFRNKAKMAVGGHWRRPVLGILDHAGEPVSLTHCPLYPDAIRHAFGPLIGFIRKARLMPYDVANRRGELKYLLLTHSDRNDELMLRFVLRSRDGLAAIQAHLPGLLARLPGLVVVSANIQPEHKAVLEGPEEIPLTDNQSLTMWLNDRPFHLRPRSFFQTNTAVAALLYRTAADWVGEIAPSGAWDLFCGVGGFALHLAPHVDGAVTGIEISDEAIASARQTAAELGLDNVGFRSLAADEFVSTGEQVPPLVVVNPPRRGLGEDLCRFLDRSTARWLLYSSCNPATLAADLARMPGFRPIRARMFDIFPHTTHAELLVLLQRG